MNTSVRALFSCYVRLRCDGSSATMRWQWAQTLESKMRAKRLRQIEITAALIFSSFFSFCGCVRERAIQQLLYGVHTKWNMRTDSDYTIYLVLKATCRVVTPLRKYTRITVCGHSRSAQYARLQPQAICNIKTKKKTHTRFGTIKYAWGDGEQSRTNHAANNNKGKPTLPRLAVWPVQFERAPWSQTHAMQRLSPFHTCHITITIRDDNRKNMELNFVSIFLAAGAFYLLQ